MSDDEAVAAAIGLRNAVAQPIGGIADAAISALVKITQLLPRRLRSEAEAIETAVSVPTGRFDDIALDTLTALARSSRDNERLRFA